MLYFLQFLITYATITASLLRAWSISRFAATPYPIRTVVGLFPCATNVAIIMDNPGSVVSRGCRPGPTWCCHRLLLLLLATQLNSVTQPRSVRNGATLTDDSQYHFRALSGGGYQHGWLRPRGNANPACFWPSSWP